MLEKNLRSLDVKSVDIILGSLKALKYYHFYEFLETSQKPNSSRIFGRTKGGLEGFLETTTALLGCFFKLFLETTF